MDMLATWRWRQLRRLALAAAATGSLVGCKVGPDFSPPQSMVRSQWNLAAHPQMQGAPAQLEQWWLHFHDPTLHQLIGQSLIENLTLREACLRISEAQARRGVTAGALFPQLQTAQGSFAQSRLSQNVANFFSAPPIFTPDLSPANWQVGLATSWEVDFWGKYRRSIEVADARLNATIATYDEARVLLVAELAKCYIEMRMAESRILLARKNLEIQEKTLKIAEDKRAAGVGTGLDIDQAKVNVGTTRAILPSLETARLQASHRLCVLLGRPPIDLASELGFNGTIPSPDRSLCFGIPADLVRRRPDVRRAEFELAAQSAKIGIAQADFYPQISLNGNIGYAAEDFGKLFASKSAVGLISPSFSWNLLNYGRIRYAVEAEEAAFHALCNNYRNSVLTAAQEAEDAQVAYVLGYDRLSGLSTAVDAAADAVSKAEQLYEAGSIDFGRVYVLQAGLVQQQDALAQAQAAISLSLVNLFKSLGGGWEHTCSVECGDGSELVAHAIGQSPGWHTPEAPFVTESYFIPQTPHVQNLMPPAPASFPQGAISSEVNGPICHEDYPRPASRIFLLPPEVNSQRRVETYQPTCALPSGLPTTSGDIPTRPSLAPNAALQELPPPPAMAVAPMQIR